MEAESAITLLGQYLTLLAVGVGLELGQQGGITLFIQLGDLGLFLTETHHQRQIIGKRLVLMVMDNILLADRQVLIDPVQCVMMTCQELVIGFFQKPPLAEGVGIAILGHQCLGCVDR